MSSKTTFKICGALFTFIGAVFLVSGLAILISNIKFKEEADKTHGEIIEIVHERSENYNHRHSRRRSHNYYSYIIVGYTVDDEYYESRLNIYSSRMREGQEITLYYDPDEPENVRTDLTSLPIIFIGLGGLFFMIGMTIFVLNILSVRNKKSLMTNGDVMTGTITNVKVNTAVIINGMHPFKAECESTDPYSGEKYLFSSNNIMEDITGLTGSEVKIYVDKNNRRKYYVDIKDLLNRNNSANHIHDYR